MFGEGCFCLIIDIGIVLDWRVSEGARQAYFLKEESIMATKVCEHAECDEEAKFFCPHNGFTCEEHTDFTIAHCEAKHA